MRSASLPAGPSSATRRAWRALLATLLTALVMAWPGVAQPHSLFELLEMPLEQLLALQATPWHAAAGAGPAAGVRASASLGGRR